MTSGVFAKPRQGIDATADGLTEAVPGGDPLGILVKLLLPWNE